MRRVAVAAAAASLVAGVQAQPQGLEPTLAALADLADLSLEQLASIEITSVSRRAEPLKDAPASIFVITADDIRRAGVTSLPEALRLAPNLEVARANSAQYAISARGFKDALGNKLLVLQDGRTIYSTLLSGVFWDAQDVVLEDIDRIEVISGPGGTLWGSNAVNGVINIVTRPAAQTQGWLVSAGTGNVESGAVLRHGAALPGGGHYRVYARHFDRGHLLRADGSAARDRSDKLQAGFRADWSGSDGSFTLQGDLYNGGTQKTTPEDTRVAGANLLGRWSRTFADGSSSQLQAYYDRTRRLDPGVFRDEMQMLDIEFQHGWDLTAKQRFMWGAGYRVADDRIDSGPVLAFLPAEKQLRWSHVFVLDKLALRPALNLTLGAKWETNVYTGTEFLPNARLDWKPAPDHLLWTALSRAVRAPARIDRDFFIPAQPPFVIAGGSNFESEVSNVFELGYRAQPAESLSLSVTAFRHLHDKLRSGQPGPAGFEVRNMMEGSVEGAEGWLTWQAAGAWRLSAGFLELNPKLQRKPGSLDPTGPSALGNDPRHQGLLRSALTLGHAHEIDVTVRHVGSLPQPAVPAYTAVDARWGWRVHRDVELSLAVQNLGDPSHLESGDAATGSRIGRSAFLKLLWEP
jgi:iron complex outermembrane receptor protein